MEHQSVLLKETIDALNVKENGIYVDGTLGRGGHSKLLVSKLSSGHLYAFDKDLEAIEESKEELAYFIFIKINVICTYNLDIPWLSIQSYCLFFSL